MSKTITGMNPKANCGVLNPPLRGIVQLTNSAALRFRNWSFNNKKPLLPMAHVVKAVKLLHKADITLIGYIRGGKINIYFQERRVKI
jgi:hypothetical protein